MEGILRSDPPMSAQSEGWKTGVYLSTPMLEESESTTAGESAILRRGRVRKFRNKTPNPARHGITPAAEEADTGNR